MDDLIKKFIEKHIENIFREIWDPVEKNFHNQFLEIKDEQLAIKKQIKSIRKKIAEPLIQDGPIIDVSGIDKSLLECHRLNESSKEYLFKLSSIEKNIKNEIYNVMNNNSSQISVFIDNLVRASIRDQSREFELRCVAYMQSVDAKIKLLNVEIEK